VEKVELSLEDDKDASPFLAGVPAIVEALKSGQIECRVYDRENFHAKTYHFGGDANRQSINDVWWLMNPAGELVI
jgi:hypothetical protein